MGNWNISIQGVGCHHNGKPHDVEQLARKFVSELRAAGHSIEFSSVTTGSRIDVDERPEPRDDRGRFTKSLTGMMAALLLGIGSLALAQCPPGKVCPIPSAASVMATILFDVQPPDGEVWIGETKLAGHKLTTCPLVPLKAGGKYRYEAKVRWPNGAERTLSVRFSPGETVRVSASLAAAGDGPPGESIEGAKIDQDGGVNFGLIGPLAAPSIETFEVNGQAVPRFAGVQSLTQIPDDRKSLRLTLIGPKEFTDPILQDLDKSPLKPVAENMLVRSYAPDAWQVKESGFAGGTQIYLQAPDGKVLHRSETYGGPESLVTAIRKADPTYRADRDPNLSGSDGGDSIGLIVLLAIVGFVAAKL